MCRLTDDIPQGAKASMKRERNQKDGKAAKSQTKSVREPKIRQRSKRPDAPSVAPIAYR